MKQLLANLRSAIVIGTPKRIAEKKDGISFEQTFEMKMPIDEAETAVRLC